MDVCLHCANPSLVVRSSMQTCNNEITQKRKVYAEIICFDCSSRAELVGGSRTGIRKSVCFIIVIRYFWVCYDHFDPISVAYIVFMTVVQGIKELS